jgi:hypothetical protein
VNDTTHERQNTTAKDFYEQDLEMKNVSSSNILVDIKNDRLIFHFVEEENKK